MTSHSPMTYDDFISQVEEAMLPDSPLRVEIDGNSLTFSVADKANFDFKFEDMEVGKIYVLWSGGSQKLWFLTPSVIQDINNYSVYWCYYNILDSKPGISKQSSEAVRCDSWGGYVWSYKMWRVLENNIFNAFINWNENPFVVK